MVSELKEQKQIAILKEEIESLEPEKWYQLLDSQNETLDKSTKDNINENLKYLDDLLNKQYRDLLSCIAEDNKTAASISKMLPIIWKIYGIAYYISLYLLALQSFLKEPNKGKYKLKVQLYFSDNTRNNLQNTQEFTNVILQCFKDALIIRVVNDSQNKVNKIYTKLVKLFSIFYINITNSTLSKHINVFNSHLVKITEQINDQEKTKDDSLTDFKSEKARSNKAYTIFHEIFQNVVLNIFQPGEELKKLEEQLNNKLKKEFKHYEEKDNNIFLEIRNIVEKITILSKPEYEELLKQNISLLTQPIKWMKQNSIITISAIATIAYCAVHGICAAIGISLLATPIGALTIGTTILVGLAALWTIYGIYKLYNRNKPKLERKPRLSTCANISPFDRKYHINLAEISKTMTNDSTTPTKAKRNKKSSKDDESKQTTEQNILTRTSFLPDLAIATFLGKKPPITSLNIRRKSITNLIAARFSTLRKIDMKESEESEEPSKSTFTPPKLPNSTSCKPSIMN